MSMDFMVNIDLKKLPRPISYRDRILLIGSCFTEHIGNTLQELKFPVLQNPHGILFDPASVCKSLVSYIQNKKYEEKDLFNLNEVWNSWEHHSRFSNTNARESIRIINESQEKAHRFLKEADWIIITLGSSFSYRLTENGEGVANCHRAPAQWFKKHMLAIEETLTLLDNCYHQLMRFNPKLSIIFTISPVRHLRDGVVDNNRSKARLLEAVHHMVNKFDRLHYFPAYELVIDVLRDYRFYDIDLAHPNYMATEFVLEKFAESCIDDDARLLMQEIKKIVIARKHKAFQPDTNAHKQFLQAHAEKVSLLQEKYPFIDLSEELEYFNLKMFDADDINSLL
jgi:hypothetical protein